MVCVFKGLEAFGVSGSPKQTQDLGFFWVLPGSKNGNEPENEPGAKNVSPEAPLVGASGLIMPYSKPGSV